MQPSGVYYNDNEPYACAWLRELMNEGLIPSGVIDERSIEDVEPADVAGFRQCHWFAGIGGWAHALELARWPEDREVWTGSCPCQPFSTAGHRTGSDDPRHLWPAWLRLIRELRPEHVFGEQVAGAVGFGWLDDVSADLEAEKYAVGATVLGAHSVGAPHQRQRLWFVAHAHGRKRPRERLPVRPRGPLEAATDSGRSGAHGRLADAKRAGASRPNIRPGFRFAGAGSHESELHESRPSGSQDGCMAHTHSIQCGGVAESERSFANGKARGRQQRDGKPADDCRTGPIGGGRRLGYPKGQGLERHPGHGNRGGEPGWLAPEPERSINNPGFWGDGVFVGCDDGKARLAEPGILPLAHGVPARVGRLRGYGNAVVPQVAAEFVTAFLETGE